jgi:hypothetical protein
MGGGSYSFMNPYGEVDHIMDNASYTTTQADGAIVHVLRTGGRNRKFSIVIEGEQGITTAIKNLSPQELRSLSRRYGFQFNNHKEMLWIISSSW